MVDGAAAANRLPAAFLTRILWQESRFRTDVISPAGAQGVAQFMPQTAAERGLADPYDPGPAIAQAARLLAELGGRFGNLGLAAAAYNAGPARVAKFLGAQSDLPEETRMAEFTRLQLAPGVEPPPRPGGPPPPWLAKRPAGVRALVSAFEEADLDLAALRRFTQPVLFVLGGRSNPDYFAQMAQRLAAVFPDFTVETFADRHHFDPPHRTEPEPIIARLPIPWCAARRPGRLPVCRSNRWHVPVRVAASRSD